MAVHRTKNCGGAAGLARRNGISLANIRARSGGFTIIEILVVVAIIIVLAGIIIAVGTSVRQSAQRRQTSQELKILESMMKEYMANNGDALPKGVTDMASFIAAVKVYPPYEKILNDLAGKAYNPGTNSVKDAFGFDILFERGTPDSNSIFRSVGPNGVPGGADDILSNEAAH